MIELLSVFLLLVLVTLILAPGFALRLLVKLYPHDDSRCQELLAELYVTKRFERPLFVAEQFETALREGVPQRAREIRSKVRNRRSQRKAPETNSTQSRVWIDVPTVDTGTLAQQTTAARETSEVVARGGRAVLLGEWGTGKTTVLTAVRRLLEHTQEKDEPIIPVPVDAWSWDLEVESFQDLVARELGKVLKLSPAETLDFTEASNIVPLVDNFDRVHPAAIPDMFAQIDEQWSGRPIVLTFDPGVISPELTDAKHIDVGISYTGEQAWHRLFLKERYFGDLN